MRMRVTVSFYARLRELAGCRTWACEVRPAATVADVWRVAETQFPSVSALAGRISCAVNADFAKMGTEVREGDDVAFLPPVSGG